MGNEQTERLSVTIRPDQIKLLEGVKAERRDLSISAAVRWVLDDWAERTGRNNGSGAVPDGQ